MRQSLQQSGDEVTPATVQQWLAQGQPVCVVDVREVEEYQQAHVAGSVLIPLGTLAQRLHELPTDRPLVVMCRSGNRSQVAARLLRNAGRRDVQNLTGGIIAWSKANLPVEQGG